MKKKLLRAISAVGVVALAAVALAACGDGVATPSAEELGAVISAGESVATAVAGKEGIKGVVTAAEGVATVVAEAGGVQAVVTGLIGLLEVRVTDAPPEGVTSIVVSVSNIEVHRADAPEDQGWLTLFESSTATESTLKIFDLVELTGIEEVLGTEELPVGKYTQIRMAVDKVVVTHEGTEKEAVLPGDKLKVVRPFDVEGDLATVLTLDFDAAKSVVITGAGRVQFKPTVKLLIRKENRERGDGAPSQRGRPESSGSDRPERPDSGAGRPGDAGQTGRPDSGSGRPGEAS